MHLIEPLGGGGEEGRHALYKAQHLRQKAGTCGVSNTSLESMLGPRTLAAFRPRVRRPCPASSLATWACVSPGLPCARRMRVLPAILMASGPDCPAAAETAP